MNLSYVFCVNEKIQMVSKQSPTDAIGICFVGRGNNIEMLFGVVFNGTVSRSALAPRRVEATHNNLMFGQYKN